MGAIAARLAGRSGPPRRESVPVLAAMRARQQVAARSRRVTREHSQLDNCCRCEPSPASLAVESRIAPDSVAAIRRQSISLTPKRATTIRPQFRGSFTISNVDKDRARLVPPCPPQTSSARQTGLARNGVRRSAAAQRGHGLDSETRRRPACRPLHTNCVSVVCVFSVGRSCDLGRRGGARRTLAVVPFRRQRQYVAACRLRPA
jgi:hypothetical protein